MTDTIPNVPRELKPCPFCGGEPNLTTADYVHDDLTPMPVVECKSCSAWVQADDWNTRAPSPAGVDGDFGWLLNLDLPEAQCNCQWNPDSHDKTCPVYLRDRLSDAQAIIGGLQSTRAEYRELSIKYYDKLNEVLKERDQQAQRIGELEGLLLRVQVSLSLDDTEWGYSGAEKYKLLADIRAALSAGKDSD